MESRTLSTTKKNWKNVSVGRKFFTVITKHIEIEENLSIKIKLLLVRNKEKKS